jgi:hypothetical protein
LLGFFCPCLLLPQDAFALSLLLPQDAFMFHFLVGPNSSTGCWRMRDIGQGQTVKILVTPKVRELIRKVTSSEKELDLSQICCWLMYNSLQVSLF